MAVGADDGERGWEDGGGGIGCCGREQGASLQNCKSSQRNNGTSVTSRRKHKWKLWATAWPHSTAPARLHSASIHTTSQSSALPSSSPTEPTSLHQLPCTCLLHHFIFRITPAPSHYALPRSFYLPAEAPLFAVYISSIYFLYIPPSIPSSHHCTFRLPSFPTMHPIDPTEDAPHAVRSPEVWGFIITHTLLSSPPSTELL